MRLRSIELTGFKSFAKKTSLQFGAAITAIVGPNGSGKSNVAESFRFCLGEQSMKSMRGRRGEDLIWNGSGSSPRAGRAAVKLVFDNTDRSLNLDFDEVAIERVIHRGGGGEYLLNGSVVRLRDIQELLSGANIGTSGHHIISQGEADRILSASSPERREMLEDALGLTGFLYKREEAERKLHKTGENMHEVEALRRELLPHLKFLGAQVRKLEDAKKLREGLAEQLLDYLAREHLYLCAARAELGEGGEPERERAQLERQIQRLRARLEGKHDAGTEELMALERQGADAARQREELLRELGAVEGEMRARAGLGEEGSVPLGEARGFAERVVALAEGSKLSDILALARAFLQKFSRESGSMRANNLSERASELERQLKGLGDEERKARERLAALRKHLETQKDASRDAERELFQAMARRSELEGAAAVLRARREALAREEEHFAQEAREAAVLLGAAPAYEEHTVVFEDEPRSAQEERRRKLERQKIRLEEAGLGAGEEILREHAQASEREQFLARELRDLEQSAASLRGLIAELTETLEERFAGGIERINEQFDAFFKLMFGGGSATLQLIKEKRVRRVPSETLSEGENLEDDEEDAEVEEGVDISVSLPHKRIKGLHALSGGERALTSIALIFAMSQVNPPPFLILDETDAALDEANSRRNGDMIENLAKKSQLILITHNRETMSRAGVLYGVTMGQDGVSKLLSVKFEDAVAVAK